MEIFNGSVISPEARIGKDVSIGPFCYIAADVEIGEGCVIEPNVTIYDHVKLGPGCHVFPGAVVGAVPQDLKFDGEYSRVEIGERTTIRECVTINRGTAASGKALTRIGSDCLIMSYVHVAHDCLVGDHCILVSYVGLAGETEVGDWAIIGGGTVVHQFSKVGVHAMVGGGSVLTKDIPPYALASGNPVACEGINIVGLRRRGFSPDTVKSISEIYRTIFQSGLNTTNALAKVEAEFPASPQRDAIIGFIRSSSRGIARYGRK